MSCTVDELRIYLQAYWPEARVSNARSRHGLRVMPENGATVSINGTLFDVIEMDRPDVTAGGLARMALPHLVGRRTALWPSSKVRASSLRGSGACRPRPLAALTCLDKEGLSDAIVCAKLLTGPPRHLHVTHLAWRAFHEATSDDLALPIDFRFGHITIFGLQVKFHDNTQGPVAWVD